MSGTAIPEPKASESSRLPTRTMAVKIAVAYGAVSTAWIFTSGWALHYFVQDHRLIAHLETLKGWFFVIVTGSLFGVALDRYFQTITQKSQRNQLK
jgi:hypothetical protein